MCRRFGRGAVNYVTLSHQNPSSQELMLLVYYLFPNHVNGAFSLLLITLMLQMAFPGILNPGISLLVRQLRVAIMLHPQLHNTNQSLH